MIKPVILKQSERTALDVVRAGLPGVEAAAGHSHPQREGTYARGAAPRHCHPIQCALPVTCQSTSRRHQGNDIGCCVPLRGLLYPCCSQGVHKLSLLLCGNGGLTNKSLDRLID